MEKREQPAKGNGQEVGLFYSYARQDEDLREKLEKHLTLLRQRGWITGWYDRLITGGGEWEKETSEHLEAAQIILLLVSNDFLASDYC